MSQYLKIPLSEDKRHFVVGDIHGRYDTFLSLLEEIDYNEETDMIYSVGDLIDRGPKSVEVVKFFQKSNTWVTLGNHEQMVINPDEWYNTWMYFPNGGPATQASLREHGLDIPWLQNIFKKFPICLDVGDDDNPNAFRIIHAEQPPEWPNDTFLWFLKGNHDDAPEGQLLWGRNTISRAKDNIRAMRPAGHGIEFPDDWPKRNIFCGHTPGERIIRVHNMYWIDTFWGATMSMMNAVTLEKFTVKLCDDNLPTPTTW